MTNIGIFSSLHGGRELLDHYKWDDQKAIAAFDRFKPDIVCGEVRPEDLENGEKKYPIEYDRYIFDYCKSRNIPFVPCDYWTMEDYELTQKEGDVLEAALPDGSEGAKQWEAMMQDFWESGLKSEIPFNSVEFNNIARHKHELQNTYSPDAHRQTWAERNRRIVENLRKVIVENPGKNILVIFGAEHSYWYIDEFGKEEALRVTFPI